MNGVASNNVSHKMYSGSQCKTLVQKHQGFTLIELVAVIVLLGIVAVTVAPKFASRDGYTDYAARDQIIAAARLAQQRAMYDQSSNTCYRLSVSGNRIYVQRGEESGGSYSYSEIGPSDAWLLGIPVESGAVVNDIDIYFDSLGNAISTTPDCAGAPSNTPILVQSTSNPQACIYATGYIQTGPCP